MARAADPRAEVTAATYKSLPRSPHRRRGEEPFDLPPMLGEVPGRPGRTVRRYALLAALREEHAARVMLVTAPAGSGKTTLLRQWAHENPRPVAWLSSRAEFSDPVVLVRGLTQAIANALGGPVANLPPAARGGDAFRSLARLVRAISLDGRAMLLIVDDIHELADKRALDVLAYLADSMPATWRIGFATRRAVSLPVTRWRINRNLAEFGFADLAMDQAECAQMLAELGISPSEELAREIHRRTEGWAAGIYLAGLSLKAGQRSAGPAAVNGDDDLIRSYLETEILAEMEPATYDMLVRTSVVDEVSAPLADAITGNPGSAARLYELARSNHLVMALDSQRRWFRYHGLLRDLLARRLEELEPGAGDAHRRAALWYESAGRIDDAIDHALWAGDGDEAARLALAAIEPMYASGQLPKVRRWLASLPPDTVMSRHPLARAAALTAALEGDPVGAAQWSAAPDIDEWIDAGPDAALVRAMLCAGGPTRMLRDATESLTVHDGDWRWRPLANLAAGAARAMAGDETAAQAQFADAEQSPHIESSIARFAIRAERALAAAANRQWPVAASILIHDRRTLAADPGAGGAMGMSWLVADARLAIHRGDRRLAEERLEQTQIRQALLSSALPWLAVRTLIEIARARLLMGDSPAALAALAQARKVIDVRPDLGKLPAIVEDVTSLALASRVERLPGGSTLTAAELRLLPLLQTYLNFEEIADRLGVSRNTVKTQAMSIYAKLGVTSRGEAVTSAVGYGLLEDIFA
jgi:LuxR family transcriptional regulator, maltose regulon positive regulatory protein